MAANAASAITIISFCFNLARNHDQEQKMNSHHLCSKLAKLSFEYLVDMILLPVTVLLPLKREHPALYCFNIYFPLQFGLIQQAGAENVFSRPDTTSGCRST